MESRLIDIDLLDISPTGILIMDVDGEITYANKQAEEILGLSASLISERAYNSPAWNIQDHEGNKLPKGSLPFAQVMEKETMVLDFKHTIESPDGEIVYLSVNAAPIKNGDGVIEGVIANFEDVSANVLKEQELQENKERYKNLFDNLIDEVHIWKFVTNKKDEIINWELVEANPIALKNWGKELEEVQGKKATDIFGEDALITFMPIVEEIYKTGKPIRWEKYFAATRQYLSMDSIPIGNTFISTGRDITAIKNTEKELIKAKETAERSEKKLKRSVAEKEALLMEVHHRVKNNLALISAMLYLQENEYKDEEFSGLILDTQSRIKSIANVHELIYQNESFAEINVDQYIEKIYEQVQQIYIKKPDRITFNSQLEPIVLVVEEAIPLALIVNEVLANALKHAFQNKSSGTIDVALSQHQNTIELEITDNGVGLSEDFNIDDSGNLGLTLIKQFTTQLEGAFELSSEHSKGTTFSLTFTKTDAL